MTGRHWNIAQDVSEKGEHQHEPITLSETETPAHGPVGSAAYYGHLAAAFRRVALGRDAGDWETKRTQGERDMPVICPPARERSLRGGVVTS